MRFYRTYNSVHIAESQHRLVASLNSAREFAQNNIYSGLISIMSVKIAKAINLIAGETAKVMFIS